MLKKNVFLIILLVTFFKNGILAQNTIDGLYDINCDGQLRMAFTGDSITYGVGDTKNNGKGGYVKRIQNKFINTTVSNIGVPGVTSRRLYSSFRRNLKRENSKTWQLIKEADYIFIAVGVNDYWDKKGAKYTLRNIKRLVRLLKDKVPEISKIDYQPLIKISTLLKTNRSFQQPFVDEVNNLLLNSSSNNISIGIKFHKLSVALHSDELHPTSQGYRYMAKKAKHYIKKPLQREALSQYSCVN